MRHAVYAGTFDPFTNGHLAVYKQIVPLFDKITLAIGVNPLKPSTMFTLAERLSFLRDVSLFPLTGIGWFEIQGPDAKYLVNYAESIDARFIVRGLRSASDFEYEYQMCQVNRILNPRIQTVFVMAESNCSYMSSSMVRGLIGPKDWQIAVKDYIPTTMLDRFIEIAEIHQRG